MQQRFKILFAQKMFHELSGIVAAEVLCIFDIDIITRRNRLDVVGDI